MEIRATSQKQKIDFISLNYSFIFNNFRLINSSHDSSSSHELFILDIYNDT